MNGNMVITIGRESGSGGKHIGQLVAERLGIQCYDKELLALAAKNSGLCEEIFETHDEKPTNSFLYSLVFQLVVQLHQLGRIDKRTVLDLAGIIHLSAGIMGGCRNAGGSY